MDGAYLNFLLAYDTLREAVEASDDNFPEKVKEWFKCIDRTPGIASIVSKLENDSDYKSWKETYQRSNQNKAEKIDWPKARRRRVGLQLVICRALVERTIAADGDLVFLIGYARQREFDGFFFSTFASMSDALLDELRDIFGDPRDIMVPASDRVVQLNHNGVAYNEALNALDVLERAIREANDYPDDEDKEQRLAEVSATRRLLQSARVRVGLVLSVIGPTIFYLGKQFANSGIGRAAAAAWDKIVQLLNLVF